MPEIIESTWFRSDYCSIWRGPDLELIVVPRGDGFLWTCEGWRRPDDAERADQYGWVWAPSRAAAEKAAIRYYLQKDE